MNNILKIINADDREINVYLIKKNEPYGSDNNLIYKNSEPIIEFFDASLTNEDDTSELGYFTGIRCLVEIIFTVNFSTGSEADILFNESLPMWTIDDENINTIRAWLKDKHDYDFQKYDDNNISMSSKHKELLTIINELDKLEMAYKNDIKIRIQIIKAKKNLLKAC
jgi:hypothetical protein